MAEEMPSELDRWRAAQQLINQHGENAELEGSQLADRAVEQGSSAGEKLWLDVIKKVRVLRSEAKSPGETLN